MKYYLLNWEEKGNPVPRIRNWMDRLDYHAIQRKEMEKLPERTILLLEENKDTLFCDIVEKPFLLVSKMFWEISKMYEVPVRGKEMILLDGVNGFAEIYYMARYPTYECLSEKAVFNHDRSVIHRDRTGWKETKICSSGIYGIRSGKRLSDLPFGFCGKHFAQGRKGNQINGASSGIGVLQWQVRVILQMAAWLHI